MSVKGFEQGTAPAGAGGNGKKAHATVPVTQDTEDEDLQDQLIAQQELAQAEKEESERGEGSCKGFPREG